MAFGTIFNDLYRKMYLAVTIQAHCIGSDPDQALPSGKGSYALLLHLDRTEWIQIGRLGEWRFAAGYYLYLGSALGPGGLAARLRRHLSADKRPFWHVDYLRCRASVVNISYLEEPVRYEHAWAAAAVQLPGATIPVSRFGASDCRCLAHLVYFSEQPSIASLHIVYVTLYTKHPTAWADLDQIED